MKKIVWAGMLALGISTSGCAFLVNRAIDNALDRAFETKKERKIRKEQERIVNDKHRLTRGEPLKDHKDRKDLRKHKREPDWQDSD